ncbi:MAG: tetratricopeptide repeat protein [Chitinophagaceae bacterium]|nr:tetratricopeptide repeat protein [Chitinophagaceae bacterium]
MQFTRCLFVFCFLIFNLALYAQSNSTLELSNKPKAYENRQLRAEKTGQKKLTAPGRFFQNTFTRYNYYFNANNKLALIIDQAQTAFREDYSTLLPFYNYTLDATAANQNELDSVIYKSVSGILLHDLRSDWTDDMYLLLGKAYFLRKDFDSANAVFQFINYAFAPKEEGGYDIPLGSNLSNTNGIFSVSTEEKKNWFKKSPVRNEALLWLTRSYIESGQNGIANGILQILKHDPAFPERLYPQLNEMLAYHYYTQKIYDTAAAYLSHSLNATDNKQEKARREFLIAQLYELSGNNKLAVQWYSNAANHATDPVLEVFANLHTTVAAKDSAGLGYKQKLDHLLQMAKREKYAEYRDIIYYAAAQMAMNANDKNLTRQLLIKSTANSSATSSQKALSFFTLGDIDFSDHHYDLASADYDSIQLGYLTEAQKLIVSKRKPVLQLLITNLTNIKVQDSIQYLSSLPETERNALLRKKNRQGKMADQLIGGSFVPGNNSSADLFNTSSSSEWYFNNNVMKNNGFKAFRAQWGNRPNVDNWRRQSFVDMTASGGNIANNPPASPDAINKIAADSIAKNLSYPLTEEQLTSSNKIIEESLLSNAKIFQDDLMDYSSSAEVYKELGRRFPEKLNEQGLFALYNNLSKSGNYVVADSVKSVLLSRFPNSIWSEYLRTGRSPADKNQAITRQYEKIYDLFIEGNFLAAQKQKASADSLYGNNYWTPQMLFIEAIYYVKLQQDSAAINKLSSLVQLHPSSPLAERARTMIDVLNRRSQIESYLTSLNVNRKEDEVVKAVDLSTPESLQKPKTDLSVVIQPDKKVIEKKDSIVHITQPAAVTTKQFTFNPDGSHFVIVLLDKVDPVFTNEVRNAFNRFNQEKYYSQPLTITNTRLNDQYLLVQIGGFKDAGAAMEYVDKNAPLASTRIIPWLKKDKYRFLIISNNNLALLKENGDLDGYINMLQKALPGKF